MPMKVKRAIVLLSTEVRRRDAGQLEHDDVSQRMMLRVEICVASYLRGNTLDHPRRCHDTVGHRSESPGW